MRYTKLTNATAVLLLSLFSATALAGGAIWSYSGETGPENWGKLAPEWAACETGNYQSPINITNAVGAGLGDVEPKIKPTPLAFGLDGPTFAVVYQAGSTLKINDVRYELKQFHFHHTSEHQLFGKYFPLEAHLVMQSEHSDHADAVLGIFIESGKENAMLNQFFGVLPRSDKKSREGIMVNVGDLLPASKRYYTYEGSMTTPACAQSVRWFVMEEPVQASLDQLGAFVSDLTEGNSNNRPLQPAHGRSILRGN